MTTLILVVKIGIYILMAASLVAALGVMLLPNIFHAALALAFVLASTAALFIALGADFLALVQILIYVGAVMTLVIFAIMLTTRLSDNTIRQHNRLGLPALVGSAIFLAALGRILLNTPWPIRPETLRATVTTADLGRALMGPYGFPFEVISVILIAALIGAIVVARRDKP